ncbi:MAG: FAD-dependent monooxygenase [Roseococcus sp.]|nr:FAD-dependent monooxygenase [Roseococcus sp.]
MQPDRVIIVGAGPVGLVAAAALAAEGIPVAIIEAERELPDGMRASTFHPPTLDMVERFGVAEGPIATFDHAMIAGDTRHPYRLQCEQWRLTRLLPERLAANPVVEFICDARALAVTQDGASVTLSIARPDGHQETLTGRYLIGADGARSAVRKSLGIGFEGQTIPEIYLTLSTPFAYHDAMEDLTNIAYISDPDEWFVLLRNLRLWRLLLPADPQEPEEVMLSDALIEERMQQVLRRPGRYEIYVEGRVFLAGDAAHVNNPLGGMGMNGGIHDALNLAEKLTSVLRGAPLAAMGRYERQRRKVALEVVQQQALRNRSILNQKDPATRQAFLDDLRATVADPERHRAHLLRTSMVQSLRDLEKVE